MKKSYLLMAAAAAATTALAQTSPQQLPPPMAGGPENSGDYVIWEAPTENTYTMNYEAGCRGLNVLATNYTYYSSDNGIKAKIVGSNSGDKYWIQRPLPHVNLSSYIVGEPDKDGNIVVKLPQWLNADVSQNTGVCLTLAKNQPNPDGNPYYMPVTEADGIANEITYTINEDEGLDLVIPDGYALIPTYRYLDEVPLGAWAQEAIYEVHYFDHEGQPLEVPGEFETWKMIYQNNMATQTLEVGFLEKDGKVYLRGVNPAFPEACIEGTIDGDEVSFANGQLIGETEYTYEYLTFHGCRFGQNMFRQDVWLFDDANKESAVLTYSPEDKFLEGPLDIAWLSNAGTGTPYYSWFAAGPSFKWSDDTVALIPQDPEIEEGSLFFFIPSMGFGQVFFALPPFATDNTPLDKEKMSWILYLDGEPFTFSPDDYAVDEEMVEVPYNYSNDEDIIIEKSGQHGVLWYIDGLQSVGLQSLYTVNGNVGRSNIVTEYNPESSVEEVAIDQAREIQYFDLQGRRVENPQQGLYIQKIITDSGRAVVSKVVK